MAFNDYKYDLQFKDRQDRLHLVFIYPDGYTGGSTSLTPSGSPVVYRAGKPNGDPYEPLMPSMLEVRWLADTDDAVEDIFGDGLKDWFVRWWIGGSEVWSGYVDTTNMKAPLCERGEYVAYATCGLEMMKGEPWDDPSTGDPYPDTRITFAEGVANALKNINPLNKYIYIAANWHSGAITGNSFEEYDFSPRAFRKPQPGEGEDRTPETYVYDCWEVLEQLNYSFLARMTMADGVWRIYQRDLLDTAYTMDVFDQDGAITLSDDGIDGTFELEDSDCEILEGVTEGVQPIVRSTQVYNHDFAGRVTFENTGFDEDYTVGGPDGDIPDGWSSFEDSGSHSVYLEIVDPLPFPEVPLGKYALRIDAEAGSDSTAAVYGIEQTGETVSGSTDGLRLQIFFTARAIFGGGVPTDTSERSGYWSLQVSTYSWNHANRTWDSGAVVKNEVKLNGAKTAFYEAGVRGYRAQTTEMPADGAITFRFYNGVSGTTPTELTAVDYDHLFISIMGQENAAYDYETTLYTATRSSSEFAQKFTSPYEMLIGDGPTITHVGRITTGAGTRATSWDQNAGESDQLLLENLRAAEISRHFATPMRRIKCSFLLTSGTFWPHMPVKWRPNQYPAGYEYSTTYLVHDARSCKYGFEGVELVRSKGTYTYSEAYEGFQGVEDSSKETSAVLSIRKGETNPGTLASLDAVQNFVGTNTFQENVNLFKMLVFEDNSTASTAEGIEWGDIPYGHIYQYQDSGLLEWVMWLKSDRYKFDSYDGNGVFISFEHTNSTALIQGISGYGTIFTNTTGALQYKNGVGATETFATDVTAAMLATGNTFTGSTNHFDGNITFNEETETFANGIFWDTLADPYVIGYQESGDDILELGGYVRVEDGRIQIRNKTTVSGVANYGTIYSNASGRPQWIDGAGSSEEVLTDTTDLLDPADGSDFTLTAVSDLQWSGSTLQYKNTEVTFTDGQATNFTVDLGWSDVP